VSLFNKKRSRNYIRYLFGENPKAVQNLEERIESTEKKLKILDTPLSNILDLSTKEQVLTLKKALARYKESLKEWLN
jgi:hypothetical protein